MKKLLSEDGWKVLDDKDEDNGEGNAWCEFSDIDREGHHRGAKLAKHVTALLMEIPRPRCFTHISRMEKVSAL